MDIGLWFGGPFSMDSRVQRAIAVMENELRTPICELALAAGVSVSQLTTLFRQDTGVTPLVYLCRLRMSRALILMKRTSLSVGEVMTLVGVTDPDEFARDFVHVHGFAPRTFWRSMRGPGPVRNVTYICSVCGASEVWIVVPSLDGAYCQCRQCGHLWHDEHKLPPRVTPVTLRRKGDRRAG
jgi:AraC-like DNA-binding protein